MDLKEQFKYLDLLLEDTLLLAHERKVIKVEDLVDEFGVTSLRAKFLLHQASDVGAVQLDNNQIEATWKEDINIEDIFEKIKNELENL